MQKALPIISKKLLIALMAVMLVASMILFISPGKIYGVTLTVGPGGPGSGYGYATIQEAINVANPGDIINIAAGVYNPTATIVVSVNNLTIQGPQANVDPRISYGSTRIYGSVEEAIIDGGGVLKMIFEIKAENIVINGLEIKSGTGDMISQVGPYSGTTVKYCIIHNGLGDEGVQLKQCVNGILEYNYVFDIADAGDGLNIADRSSGGIIRYNEVSGIHGENAAIYIYTSQHMQIIGNLVRDSGAGGNDGIKVGAKGGADAALIDVLIKDNIIHNITQDGISIYMSNVTVEGNEIYNCGSENGAIYLAYGISGITINKNKIHDNTLKSVTAAGILLATTVNSDTVTINNNDIYSNSPNGVTNKASAVLDATNNWWGDNSGPNHPSLNPLGTGNAVSDNVNFSSWTRKPLTITAVQKTGGTISPSGAVSVPFGGSQTFTISSSPHTYIVDVKVDGNSVGAVTSYTFTNVISNHTIDPFYAPTQGAIDAAIWAAGGSKTGLNVLGINESSIGVLGITEGNITDFVTNILYGSILLREPDSAGLAAWVSALSGGLTGEDAARGFVYSAELAQYLASLDNTGYLNFLYSRVLGRAADLPGLNGWLANMSSGMTKEEILGYFLNSPEWIAICNSYGVTP